MPPIVKILLQGLTLAVAFLLLWWTLDRVEWVEALGVKKISAATEKKIGDLFIDVFVPPNDEVHDQKVKSPIDSLVRRICRESHIDTTSIKVHIVKKDEVNAFALPDRHLVIYTGLIKFCDSPEELCGVVSHEIAHIELEHVMKKLTKEVGLSVLLSTTGTGSETIKKAAKILSSTAFDRRMEKAADIKAVEFLLNARIHPEPFSEFLSKMADENPKIKNYTWLSTHPDSDKRAEYIMERVNASKKPDSYIVLLSPTQWKEIKDAF